MEELERFSLSNGGGNINSGTQGYSGSGMVAAADVGGAMEEALIDL
jgi:hypothetical protein